MNITDDVKLRFLMKIEVGYGCWEWCGYIRKDGYGELRVGGTAGRAELAHRVSWEIHYGPIPEGDGYHGTCVLHRCDNPSCVRPDHLFLGSNLDNIHDRMAKGRSQHVGAGDAVARGERHGMHKLSDVEVANIRSEYATGMYTQAAIGLRYGVGPDHISRICSGKRRSRS